MFTQNKEVIAIKQGVFGDRFHTAAPVAIKLPQQYNIIGYTLHTISTGGGTLALTSSLCIMLALAIFLFS